MLNQLQTQLANQVWTNKCNINIAIFAIFLDINTATFAIFLDINTAIFAIFLEYNIFRYQYCKERSLGQGDSILLPFASPETRYASNHFATFHETVHIKILMNICEYCAYQYINVYIYALMLGPL